MSGAPDLRLSDPEIVEVWAVADASAEPHASWSIGYASAPESDVPARVLIATLRVAGKSGRADVVTNALVIGEAAGQTDSTVFRGALSSWDALNVLYGYASVALRSALALVDSDATVPPDMPEPEFVELVRRREVETSDEAPAPDGTSS